MKRIPILLLALLAVACKKENEEKGCEIECGYMVSTVLMSGYAKEEIDTVYLRYYESNWQFNNLVKEDQLSLKDSIPLAMNTGGGMYLTGLSRGKDYMIIVPATSDTFSITMTHDRIFDTLPCGKAYSCNKALIDVKAVTGKNTGYAPNGSSFYLILKK